MKCTTTIMVYKVTKTTVIQSPRNDHLSHVKYQHERHRIEPSGPIESVYKAVKCIQLNMTIIDT